MSIARCGCVLPFGNKHLHPDRPSQRRHCLAQGTVTYNSDFAAVQFVDCMIEQTELFCLLPFAIADILNVCNEISTQSQHQHQHMFRQ